MLPTLRSSKSSHNPAAAEADTLAAAAVAVDGPLAAAVDTLAAEVDTLAEEVVDGDVNKHTTSSIQVTKQVQLSACEYHR